MFLLNVISTSDLPQVTLDVKVLANLEPTFVSGGKKKQDIIGADSTATAKLTVWESYVYVLDKQSCYTLKNVVVQEYASTKYLSMPKEGCEFIKIGDIKEDYDTTEQSH